MGEVFVRRLGMPVGRGAGRVNQGRDEARSWILILLLAVGRLGFRDVGPKP